MNELSTEGSNLPSKKMQTLGLVKMDTFQDPEVGAFMVEAAA